MLKEISVTEGAYLRNILDQPRAVSATCAALASDEDLKRIASRLNRGNLCAWY